MVAIHTLVYGKQEITNQAVCEHWLNAITHRLDGMVVSTQTLSCEPQPDVKKRCQIVFRYFDKGGPVCDWLATEGDIWDFGPPEIRELAYGGVSIMNKPDAVARVKDVIKYYKDFPITNDPMGGDTDRGRKRELVVTYVKTLGFPLTQFISREDHTISFRHQIALVADGNRVLFERPFVNAMLNGALQDCMLDLNSNSYVLITNETMGGDPAVGISKTCNVEIDKWDLSQSRVQHSTWEGKEGAR